MSSAYLAALLRYSDATSTSCQRLTGFGLEVLPSCSNRKPFTLFSYSISISTCRIYSLRDKQVYSKNFSCRLSSSRLSLKSSEAERFSSRQLYWKPESSLILVSWEEFLGRDLPLSSLIYYIISMRALVTGVLVACLLLAVSAADLSDPQYTEEVEVFKKDNLRGRMEVLLGCWLLSRDIERDASEGRQLALLKACMRRISRKDSVVKITSLIGKNMAPPKTYQQVVGQGNVPLVAEEGERSEFDQMLLEYVRGYAKDIEGVEKGKEGEDLRKKVEEEMVKRQKYYFGVIPVNEFTHTLMLVGIAILMVIVCTCWKYYSRKGQKKEGEQESQDKSYFSQHNHKHNRESFTKSPKPKRA